jgi:hypothetical protein
MGRRVVAGFTEWLAYAQHQDKAGLFAVRRMMQNASGMAG